MQIQRIEPIKQIIRYQEQLKTVSQKITLLILDNSLEQVSTIRQLITEEEQLIKYIEVQNCKLNPQSKAIYHKNLQLYKRKLKQHKDFLGSNHGNWALPKSKQQSFMEYQKRNADLAQNKLTMYENQRIQQSMGRQVQYQGEKLYGGIEQTRQIRRSADQAEGSIKLIKMSILKRKMMFGSLVVFFCLSLILVIIIKARK